MQRTQVGGTVITGATGFVGGQLAAKLLRDSTRTLFCPIRAASDQAAKDRGHQLLVSLVGEIEAQRHAPRVHWLRADIEERHLGWSDERWHDVASKTNEIYHCAASVSFDLELGQAHRINVLGTEHVFELAETAAATHDNFQRFHHVSTAFVAGITKGRIRSDFLPPDRASCYRNTYERTKARAERFLRAHASPRVPVSIHRPSIIAGDTKTGATTNWNVLYVPMKMIARGVLPVLPRGGRQLLDTIAVDFLVDAMVTFSQLDAKPLESHHVTAGLSAFTLSDLVAVAAEQARLDGRCEPSATKLLHHATTWRALLATVNVCSRLPKWFGRLGTNARLARRSIDKCSVYLTYCNVSAVFDASHDHDLLRVFGVEMPAGDQYLERIVEFAVTTRFGKDPVSQPERVKA